MAGLALTAVFGFVAFILSYGFFVPNDLKIFSFLGAIGSMAGYSLGELIAKSVRNPILRALAIIVSAMICSASVIAYVIYVQQGSAEVAEIVRLAILLTLIFFSFTFLMPLAGVVVGQIAQKNTEPPKDGGESR